MISRILNYFQTTFRYRLTCVYTLSRIAYNSEKGTAINELVVAWPFLGALAIMTLDLSMVMSQYTQLNEIVNQGIRFASMSNTLGVPGEDGGIIRNGSGAAPCNIGVVKLPSGYPQINDNSHDAVQERLARLISLQKLGVPSNNICIETRRTGVVNPADPTSNRTINGELPRTVFVRITIVHNGILPLFDGMLVSAEARGPYLGA